MAIGALFAFRRYQERRIVAISMARARDLIRSDTWLGYHEAATLLAVRAAQADPVDAGSLRAFALAMLWADYRDQGAKAEASAALREPIRAEQVPTDAQLAVAALALGDGRAGDAVTHASRAGELALAQLLAARVALLAGNLALAEESTDRALSIDRQLPAALAVKADLSRRAGRAEEAHKLYLAALAGSASSLSRGLAGFTARTGAAAPHARATFGLGKLALSREAPADEAAAHLARLLEDRTGTPQVERARAALYLAALHGRAGDRGAMAATFDRAGLDPGLRAWLEKAAGQLEVERGRYRVPDATPGELMSASDDDPYVPPPPPPPPVFEAPKQVLHGFKVQPLGATSAKAPHRVKGPRTWRPLKGKPTRPKTLYRGPGPLAARHRGRRRRGGPGGPNLTRGDEGQRGMRARTLSIAGGALGLLAAASLALLLLLEPPEPPSAPEPAPVPPEVAAAVAAGRKAALNAPARPAAAALPEIGTSAAHAREPRKASELPELSPGSVSASAPGHPAGEPGLREAAPAETRAQEKPARDEVAERGGRGPDSSSDAAPGSSGTGAAQSSGSALGPGPGSGAGSVASSGSSGSGANPGDAATRPRAPPALASRLEDLRARLAQCGRPEPRADGGGAKGPVFRLELVPSGEGYRIRSATLESPGGAPEGTVSCIQSFLNGTVLATPGTPATEDLVLSFSP